MNKSSRQTNTNSSRMEFRELLNISPPFYKQVAVTFQQNRVITNQDQGQGAISIKNLKCKNNKKLGFNLAQNNSAAQFKKKTLNSNDSASNKENFKKNTTLQNLIFKIPIQESQQNFKMKIKKYKVSRIVRQFQTKLRRTSVYRKPIIYELDTNKNQNASSQGIELPSTVFSLFLALSILATLANCFLATLIIAFQSGVKVQTIKCFSLVYIAWILVEIALGFVMIKQKGTNLRKNSLDYLKSQFIIDFTCLVSLIFRVVWDTRIFHSLQILLFLKMGDALKKLKILQDKIVQFSYQQRYWGLTKMFLTNFLLIHLIAILLLLMSKYDSNNNWIIHKNIENADWIQQYCWSFYWAATTMLTVGFGDITPANYKEALTLVVIEVVSCMVLAFNINFIGKLLSELQAKKAQEEKDKKILKRLINRNEIQENLELKLSNHIKESRKLEMKHHFDQEKQFVTRLPKNLQNDILKESNTSILQKIDFFRNFANRAICQIAEALNEKVVHPFQVVCQLNKEKITILKQGEIGLFPHIRINMNEQVSVDKFVSKDRKSAALFSMNFAKRRYTHQNYKLKSLGYSIIQWINKSQFMDILRKRAADIQFFQSFQDKQHADLQEDFQLILCDLCDKKHSKFLCPRLHYCPIAQNVIFKHLNEVKQSKTFRTQIYQRKKVKANCLIEFRNSHSRVTFNEIDGSESCSLDDPQKSFNLNRGLSLFEIDQSNSSNQEISRQSQKMSRRHSDTVKLIESQCWIIEVDKAANFQYYFSESNPKSLQKIQTKKALFKKINDLFRKTLAFDKCISKTSTFN